MNMYIFSICFSISTFLRVITLTLVYADYLTNKLTERLMTGFYETLGIC